MLLYDCLIFERLLVNVNSVLSMSIDNIQLGVKPLTKSDEGLVGCIQYLNVQTIWQKCIQMIKDGSFKILHMPSLMSDGSSRG